MAAVVGLVFWLVIVPFLNGMPFTAILPREKQTPAVIFIAGFLVHLTLFEMIAVPCMLAEVWFPFRRAVRLFIIVSLCLALCGVYFLVRTKRLYGRVFEAPAPAGRETAFYTGLFAAAVALQVTCAVVLTSFDGDDAYYVAQSVITQQTDRMYTLLPYTGLSTLLDVRHALAAVTMWEAFIARMSGLHAAVVAHTVMPVLLIPFTYLVYACAGKILFKNKPEQLPVFLILMALFQIFGNVSIYTKETFFLMRTWQGKSLMANAGCGLLLFVFCWLFDRTKTYRAEVLPGGETRAQRLAPWVLLFFVNCFCGLCTSAGVMLSAGFVALLTLFLAWYGKNLRVLAAGAASCVPNAVYVLLYLYLQRG